MDVDCEISLTKGKFIEILTDFSKLIIDELGDNKTSIKKEDMVSIITDSIVLLKLNDLVIDNRCKGSYKSGPNKGLRCKTILNSGSIFCKKHMKNNNMGIWARENSKHVVHE